MTEKKKCFVIMGFGKKTDYRTSRLLDLDKTYKHIIKPAVTEAGLECIRADEIVHSGTIDVPMYEMLMEADLVIADLSTSNVNAAYELGVRHALRPRTTIVIAEQEFAFPFDVNHISIRTYRLDGEVLDIDEVGRFKPELKSAIETILEESKPDSPVYTFLKQLTPPSMGEVEALVAAAADEAPSDPGDNPTLAGLLDQAATAKAADDFLTAKALLGAARAIAPHDPYIVQQLALVTYKSKQPTVLAALEEARDVLKDPDPMSSNDAETLGIWGAIHKRFWEENGDPADLDRSIAAYEKGYRLLDDYYNGINYAFLLNVRAANAEPADAITDFVLARRVRAHVVELCEAARAKLSGREGTEEQRYWILATEAEAALGLGQAARKDELLAEAAALDPQPWMVESTETQLATLEGHLQDSPLDRIAG